ncbi:RimK family protein [Marinicauda pacifica]|uniref:RimK family protein n=1 Tax=Marinicauda pacifica TaxID=1133559 RepID=UPI0035C7E2D5
MSDWLLLVDHSGDLAQHETPHKVLKVADYLTKPRLFSDRRPNIINLSRSYAYQSAGYYASLLAEARAHRIVPTVQSMVELSRKSLYASALPELNAALARDLDALAERPERFLVAFGRPELAGFKRFSKLLFDWFRVPAIEVRLNEAGGIDKLRPVSIHALKGERRDFFLDALDSHTKRSWSPQKARTPARWSLAVLVDPKEEKPPSNAASLKRLASVASREHVEVQPIGPNDLANLAEYDALFIRATTAIDNFTYRFARRAEQEGMPVIDDTQSMIRCTNKVYLKELLEKAGIPAPRTLILDEDANLSDVMESLGSPVVLKAPDGSFSRSVHKVATREELTKKAKALFKDTALIIAQEYMPTTFDWRVGVLGGKPLFACQYKMARGHWQIIKHGEGGKMTEGGSATFAIEDTPAEVIDIAVRAARVIGDGLYGVDIKQNEAGVFVIEVNDNPNMEHDVEGLVLKDEMWKQLIAWFAVRLETRIGHLPR